jgi:iduronate 2-sulfatase
LKFAEGGTSLEKDWQVGEKGKLYDQMMGFVERSLGELKKGGDTFEVRGFVWHQGESDAQLSAAQYEALLGNLITHVRGDVKGSMGKSGGELPVVIGEVFDNHERDSILAAERAACGKIPACALAPATGLKTEDAGTHFDAASQLELGKRMAEGMLKMVSASNVP